MSETRSCSDRRCWFSIGSSPHERRRPEVHCMIKRQHTAIKLTQPTPENRPHTKETNVLQTFSGGGTGMCQQPYFKLPESILLHREKSCKRHGRTATTQGLHSESQSDSVWLF